MQWIIQWNYHTIHKHVEARKPMEKPFLHSSVVCSSRITILKYDNRLENGYALGSSLEAGYVVSRLSGKLKLPRSICRIEQEIKWTSDHNEGVIRVQQEDCGERVSAAEGLPSPRFITCWKGGRSYRCAVCVLRNSCRKWWNIALSFHWEDIRRRGIDWIRKNWERCWVVVYWTCLLFWREVWFTE